MPAHGFCSKFEEARKQMQESKFEGIEIVQKHATQEQAIGITQMPDRKNPQLYLRTGAVIHPVASFKNAEDAAAVVEWLRVLTMGVGNG